MSTQSETETGVDSAIPSIFAEVLKPGSSRHPVFLMIVDGALALLLSVLLSLVYLTKGNVHVIALIVIELCLWGSIKWFLQELRKVHAQEQEQAAVSTPDQDSNQTENKKDQ
ncbi:unnamed protein product [Rhizoctonia solani]|uniref:V-type ATPase assembly factor PKR1 n=1 Tax=Rhizoctonia solani TaxID=456999 RepID=A0A8H2XB90_9AGAM|nr:unnamed protein product [Rhizoctonia solani]